MRDRSLVNNPAGRRGGVRAGARRLSRCVFATMALASLVALATKTAPAQSGAGITLYGDMKVDEGKAAGMKPISFDVIIYQLDGRVFSRQKVMSGGRYRFFGLRAGEYDLVVEVENQEVARMRVSLGAAGLSSDFQRDIELEWKKGASGAGEPTKKQTLAAADFYQRPPANQANFGKAQGAIDRKSYEQAVILLRQILDTDPNDFQAWTELGTAYLLQNKNGDAEKAYARAVEARPAFFLAQLNLGRARAAQKNFEGAVEPLTRAVELQPGSADANLLLGEAYLQVKKGSKAVGYLVEAARLGKPEAHLRLATLYNAAGLKDRAAAEYEQFLSKNPDHPGRKKLEQYIKENGKK
ncbi:MAG: tetratricopeptide repeat protein [Acidobacteria bacterium]|nr:tetratricopeptide repeat protein [Acidobacteriota bacterium]MCA1643293.1 tetratricopeptide repeat protein [Acidobacteriota bacterium]